VACTAPSIDVSLCVSVFWWKAIFSTRKGITSRSGRFMT
jgi:hypothetical protein